MKEHFLKTLMVCLLLPLLVVSCKDDPQDPDNPVNPPDNSNIIKDAVTDIDGNKYDAVKIGTQVWMAENLRTTHFPNGTEIPLRSDGSKQDGFRDYPDDNSHNVEKYGYLYDWYAVTCGLTPRDGIPSGLQGLCPPGWHVPSRAEWEALFDFVKSKYPDHEAQALASTEGWKECSSIENAPGYDASRNNATHFSALPAGVAYRGVSYFGEYAYFWTCTLYGENPAYGVWISYDDIRTFMGDCNADASCSLRCVRDPEDADE